MVDSDDKLPVANARVTAVRGNLSSESVLTDGDGYATEPTLPNGARDLVVRKSGFETKTVRIAP